MTALDYFNTCFIHCVDNIDLDDVEYMSKEDIFGEFLSIALQMTREKFNEVDSVYLYEDVEQEAVIKINEYYPDN